MEPLAYNEVHTRPSLEERLESIISGAALMADSSCTRDERRERIVAECNAVRQALQDLLSEYMSNVSVKIFFGEHRGIMFIKYLLDIIVNCRLILPRLAVASFTRRYQGKYYVCLCASSINWFCFYWLFSLSLPELGSNALHL